MRNKNTNQVVRLIGKYRNLILCLPNLLKRNKERVLHTRWNLNNGDKLKSFNIIFFQQPKHDKGLEGNNVKIRSKHLLIRIFFSIVLEQRGILIDILRLNIDYTYPKHAYTLYEIDPYRGLVQLPLPYPLLCMTLLEHHCMYTRHLYIFSTYSNFQITYPI